MKNSLLFLLVAMTVAETVGANSTESRREKRELLSRSKRRWVLSTIELEEENQGPFPVTITQMFNDKSRGEDNHVFRITGMGVTKDPLNTFSIDKSTGAVLVHKPIDREKYPLFHITFDILHRDTGKPVDRTLSFDVEISDINDNAPIFEHPVMRVSVAENTAEGLLPLRMQAYDKDNGINSSFSIKLLSQEPKEPKLLLEQVPSSTIMQLGFKGCFDYDKVSKYKVIVEAKDHGTPPMSSTAVINLSVQDSNTHAPTFKKRKYEGEVLEMETNKEILRVAVEDKDTPNTPGWRAKYFFVKGNEDKHYQITTDPETNEGILTVIKGRNHERTTQNDLQIGVENEEKLFVCKEGGGVTGPADADVIEVSVEVIDVNDPPTFKKKRTEVFLREESQPGTSLFEPDVTDEDSDVANIRYKVMEDPAGWVTIDPVTGVVKTIKSMDRESQYVDSHNVYTIVVAAIDDGKPPATANSTILVHLRDINDNLPGLVDGSVVMCANKADKVTVPAADKDRPPFSGPFSFALGGEDEALKETWKLDPANGEEMGLVALRSLAYGNYSVPLAIGDQQGMSGGDLELVVVVCDCGGGTTCRGKLPQTSGLGGVAIGLIAAALLLLLLLLLLPFTCVCGKQFLHEFIGHEEGNQTLIKYNQEGGGSSCTAEPTFLHTQTNSVTATDGRGLQTAPMYQISSQEEENVYQSSGTRQMISVGSQNWAQQVAAGHRDTLRSQGGQSVNSAWNSKWMASTSRNGSSRFQQTSHLLSDQIIEEYLETKLHVLGSLNEDPPAPEYQPNDFTYEGQGSRSQSLDQLSLEPADNLDFLNDLGPRFKALGGLCHQKLKGEHIQL